jgi:hypothetical protein
MFSRFEIAPLLEISEERGLRTIQAPRHDTHTDSILKPRVQSKLRNHKES